MLQVLRLPFILENTANLSIEGGDIPNFWEGGRTLYWGISICWGGLDNPLETMINKIKNKN